MRWPRGRWWDVAFVLLAAFLVWLVFSETGQRILATPIGW